MIEGRTSTRALDFYDSAISAVSPSLDIAPVKKLDLDSIAAGIRANDDGAYNALVVSLEVPVCSYVFRRLNTIPDRRETARDVSQETFLAGWQQYRKGVYKLAYPDDLIKSTHAIANNKIADVYRRNSKTLHASALPLHGVVDEVLARSPASRDHQYAQERSLHIVESRFAFDNLIYALYQLTENQREIIIQRYFNHEQSKAIAANTGRKDTNVRVTQHRALHSLRRILVEKLEQEPQDYFE